MRKIKNNISKAVLITFVVCVVLSGCTVTTEEDPQVLPDKSQATPTSLPVIDELFERYTVVGIAPGSGLNVHERPSADSPTLNQIPSHATDILPTEKVYRVGDATWVFISHHETAGWVNLEFLAEQHGTLPDDLTTIGQQVLESLRNGEYNQLTPLIHPELCLRFSPYQYLNIDNRIICPSEITSYTSSTEPFYWGQYDGTGKEINLTFIEYHQQFVYDQDYLKPSVVGFNVEVSLGNSINNIQEIFPDGIMIEYYFPGFDPQYGGMDWRSLRLVFVQENGQWYLTAIIHGEWTI